MLRFSSLLFVVAVAAQPSATLTGPVVAKAGTTVNLNLNLNSGTGPAALQFNITGLPTGGIVATSVPNKQVQCNGVVCIITATLPVSANALAPIPDGIISTITYTQPTSAATITVPSMSIIGASPTATLISITAPPAPVTVPIQSNCDINGDGKVDATDIGLSIQSVLTSTTTTLTVVDVVKEIIAANGGNCLR